MPAFGPTKLMDGQTTPVEHTFSPARIDAAGVARWEDRIGGIAIGFPVITQSMKTPGPTTKGNRAFRTTTKVVIPVLEQTSASTATGIQPAPTKAYDLIAEVTFVTPERSTDSQRKDLLAYVQGLLNHTGTLAGNYGFVKPAVVSLDGVW